MKRPLLKFDLSSIPDGATMVSAQLTMNLTGIYGGGEYFTSVWRMTTDNSTEETVTWNSYAQTGAVSVAILSGASLLGDRVWNIRMADWAYAEDLLDNAVTFMARWDDSGGGYETDGYYKANSYSSKEGTVAPTLRIEYTAAPSAPPPTLDIRNTFPGIVCVSWPTSAEGFGLVKRANLDPGNWETVTNAPSVNGARKEVLLPVGSAQLYFRLSKPAP